MLKDNFKKVTHKELGCSEDEYNNFLIDCWEMMQEKPQIPPGYNPYRYFSSDLSHEIKSGLPVSVEITIRNPYKQ